MRWDMPWPVALLGLGCSVAAFWWVPPLLGPFQLAGYVVLVLTGCMFLILLTAAIGRGNDTDRPPPGRNRP